MMDFYKEAGARIFLIRGMRGYTRECLAELAGISAKFLYEIETGKKGFSAGVLHNICDALHVRSDYILTGSNDVFGNEKLLGTLELFEQGQTERLDIILREIYKLVEVKSRKK